MVTSLPAPLREGLSAAHLPGLDGLRMVAVLLVVLFHFGFHGVAGDQGVLLFFVLSGFLITWLLLNEQERSGGISLRQFYLRRMLRIFPAFYCFWLATTGASLLLREPIPWAQAASALGYVSNYYHAIHGDPVSGFSHTWSLGVEEQFYLLWPLALGALARRDPARIARVLAGLIVTIWVYRTVLFVRGTPDVYLYEAFDTRADHLAVGCLLAVLLRHGFLPRLWHRLCTPWMSLLAVAGLVASMLLGTGYRLVIGFIVDPLLVAVLIAQVIALRGTMLWGWLNWRPVRYLGALSYSIYLYHQLVIRPARDAFTHASMPIQLGASLIAVVVAASLSYHLVERPFLRLKDRISTSPARVGQAPALAPVQEG